MKLTLQPGHGVAPGRSGKKRASGPGQHERPQQRSARHEQRPEPECAAGSLVDPTDQHGEAERHHQAELEIFTPGIATSKGTGTVFCAASFWRVANGDSGRSDASRFWTALEFSSERVGSTRNAGRLRVLGERLLEADVEVGRHHDARQQQDRAERALDDVAARASA